eukprot:10923-Pyramimonas_sp.AAC.1
MSVEQVAHDQHFDDGAQTTTELTAAVTPRVPMDIDAHHHHGDASVDVEDAMMPEALVQQHRHEGSHGPRPGASQDTCLAIVACDHPPAGPLAAEPDCDSDADAQLLEAMAAELWMDATGDSGASLAAGRGHAPLAELAAAPPSQAPPLADGGGLAGYDSQGSMFVFWLWEWRVMSDDEIGSGG